MSGIAGQGRVVWAHKRSAEPRPPLMGKGRSPFCSAGLPVANQLHKRLHVHEPASLGAGVGLLHAGWHDQLQSLGLHFIGLVG